MKNGASESVLTTILDSMMKASKAVEMNVNGLVDAYKNQASLRAGLQQ